MKMAMKIHVLPCGTPFFFLPDDILGKENENLASRFQKINFILNNNLHYIPKELNIL
jgi:hypothetical protein